MVKSIRSQALSIIRANFGIYEFSAVSGLDYRTAELIYLGRRVLPLKVAFCVLDFMGYHVSITR